MPPFPLGERKQRLYQERDVINERIEQIERQTNHQHIKQEIMAEFSAFCANAQKALEDPTLEVKQAVLRLLVEKIMVEDDAITIKHIVPIDDNSRLFPRGNVETTPIFLNPTKDCCVINRQTTLQHHFFEVAIAELKSNVPSHIEENDLASEMPPFEWVAEYFFHKPIISQVSLFTEISTPKNFLQHSRCF